MSTPTTDTWSKRELPLLRIALRESDEGRNPEFEDIASETGLPLTQVSIAMRALEEAGYLTAYFASMSSGMVLSVTERTRRTVGSWPSPESIVDRLIEALEKAAESEPDAERKTKLRQLVEGMKGVGRSVAVVEIAALLRVYLGLP